MPYRPSSDEIYARTADIKDAQIFAVAPPMISGYGTSTGFSLNLQDKAGGELTDFYNIYLKFIGALNQRPRNRTRLLDVQHQLPAVSGRHRRRESQTCRRVAEHGISTLAGYYGGQYVSNINRFSKMYYVTLQADPKYRLDTESLNNVYVRTDSGEMAPLSQFVNLTRVYSSEVLNRFNLYNSIAVNGTAASGYSSGDAIQAIREVAAEVLPKGYGFEFDGITREEAQTGSNTAIIFGICILLIYLILSALYESFFVPFAVILAVPCGLTGSFLMAKAMGLENNIYLQTGIIMLIGLLSKTAILITEYAADRRAGGMSLTQAAVSAAKARLRPILMTVTYVRVRYDPADALARCRRQRQLHARFGRRGRHDRRYAGAAVPGTYALHRLPDLAGEDQAGGVHLSRLVHPGRDRRESKRTY